MFLNTETDTPDLKKIIITLTGDGNGGEEKQQYYLNQGLISKNL